MKRLIPLAFIILFAWSCEELAEQDTPLCTECYQLHYDKVTGEFMDTVWPYEATKKLCGGDIINFETLDDIETDSSTAKHECDPIIN